MTKADKILSRVAIRRVARDLQGPCLIESDLNEIQYLREAFDLLPQRPMSMGLFLQRHTVLISEDRQDSSPEYLMLLFPERPLCQRHS